MQGIEISFMTFLQTKLSWLLPVMHVFTDLGIGPAYALFVVLFLWCIHTPTGIRMALFLSLTGAGNEVLKQLFHEPRPYWVSDEVKGLGREFAFGMPSGHATASIVWLLAAIPSRRKGLIALAACAAFLVGLSRAFLGVHFPHQILAGWLFGGLCLVLFLLVEKPAVRWARSGSPLRPVLCAFAVSLLCIALGKLCASFLSNLALPADWQARVAVLLPQGKTFAPAGLGEIPSNAGMFFGFCAGAVLLDRLGGMSAAGTLRKRLLRFPVGLACTAPLFALILVLPHPAKGSALSAAFAFSLGAVVSFFVVFPVPLLLRRLDLAGPVEKSPARSAAPLELFRTP
ncbi:MAG: phosphatase PAP2 family protein [Thermodesulfobacteriota bacterium]